MRECPNCQKVSTEFRYEAWTVKTTGVVRFDTTGIVESVGAAVATAVIKPGKEMTGSSTHLICPICGHKSSIKNFVVVTPSIFSGRRSTLSVIVPCLNMAVPITDDERDMLQQVFTDDSVAWETPLVQIEAMTTIARALPSVISGE